MREEKVKKYDINTCNINTCTKCDIHLNRSHIVNGYGKLDGGIVFIGTSPGYYENKTGIPFTGHSGKLLNSLLKTIGLTRQDVYTTNVIKCKPPDNRNPLAIEIKNCSSYLTYELYKTNPKIVVLLGNIAIRTFFGKSQLSVKKLRQYTIPYKGITVICTYHPSYILRNSDNTNLVKSYVSDFIRIGNLYKDNINPFIQFKL